MLESRINEMFKPTLEHQLLQSLRGVSFLLAAVIATDIGDIRRFKRAESLTGYAGVVSSFGTSGGRTRHGPPRKDINHHMKWAFFEAANGIVVNIRRHSDHHASRLYRRVKSTRGCQMAVVAVARHLSEATYWILT